MWSNDHEQQLVLRTLAKIEAGNMQLPTSIVTALDAYTKACYQPGTRSDQTATRPGDAQQIATQVRKAAEETARKELAALCTIRIGINEGIPRSIDTENFMKDKVSPWLTYRRVRNRVETFSSDDLADAKRCFYTLLLANKFGIDRASDAAQQVANDGSLAIHVRFFAHLVISDQIRRAAELMIMRPAIERPELLGLVHQLIAVREVIANILPLEQY